MWAGQGSILRFVNWIDFFLGPWLVVGQFIDISNQIEPTGEVANILQKNLYNAADTARNKGSFTTMVLWTVNPLFPQLYVVL